MHRRSGATFSNDCHACNVPARPISHMTPSKTRKAPCFLTEVSHTSKVAVSIWHGHVCNLDSTSEAGVDAIWRGCRLTNFRLIKVRWIDGVLRMQQWVNKAPVKRYDESVDYKECVGTVGTPSWWRVAKA